MMKITRTACLLVVVLMVGGYPSSSVSAENWVADEILQQLSELRRDYNTLRKQVEKLNLTVSQLPSGTEPRKNNQYNIPLDNAPSMGDKDARVVMIEFTDYQCPFCKRYTRNTLPKLKEAYIDTGKLFYAMKDFPLGFHAQAKPAAIAANCAGDQGQYWEMHDLLFSSGVRLSRKVYTTFANELALDLTAFEQCLSDPEQAEKVDKDVALGSSVGVRGTPAFFIGKMEDDVLIDGVFVSGAQPVEKFSTIIDKFIGMSD